MILVQEVGRKYHTHTQKSTGCHKTQKTCDVNTTKNVGRMREKHKTTTSVRKKSDEKKSIKAG